VIEAAQERLANNDAALSYIIRTITAGCRHSETGMLTIIIDYNDTHNFVDVMEILAEAKILAEADAENG
jgi:hypothetical protein